MRISKSIKPRKWQLEALKYWQVDQRGIVNVVTGGGKTVFSYLCLEYFFSIYPEGQAIIIVPTISLMDQWAIDIEDSSDLLPNEISCYSGYEKPTKSTRINIVVLNTARSQVDKITESSDVFLIVDECHRSGTSKNSKAIAGEYTATLGLSATPYRELDDGFEIYLRPSLGDVIFEYQYNDAHKDSVIVDFELCNIEISLDSKELKEFSATRHILVGVDSDKIQNQKALKIFTKASRVAWAVKFSLCHRGERIVIFHERVNSLASITKALRKYGITCVEYHSRLSPAHRRDNLRIFRRGETNVLVTCRALDEGTNIPESNIAIIAQSTSSTRQRIQRLGRVLRPAKGKCYATVYTLYSSDKERALLEEEEENLEGVAKISWKKGAIR